MGRFSMKKAASFPQPCPGGASFTVPVPTPTAAKIKAVAHYKRQQLAKRAREAQEGGESLDEGAGVGAGAVDGGDGQKLVLLAPSIGVVVPANKMHAVSDESIYRDLQGFDRNLKLLKREMNALTNVRVSLLWLLKKTTELETSINNQAAAPFTNPSHHH